MARDARDAPPSPDDVIVPFQVGEDPSAAPIRGRVVRLGGAADDILARHPFADGVNELLGEALVLTAMMGSSLKFDGRLVLQAQGDGALRMLISDYASDGALRATASVPDDFDAAAGRGLAALVGEKGHVAVTVDQGPEMDRYQGVAPLEGASFARVAVNYFAQSEQIPTAVRLAVGKIARAGAPDRWRAGGIIAQFVPGEGGARERGEAALMEASDRDAWERAAAFLETTRDDELIDPNVAPETLLYRLYHEDGVRVFPAQPVRAACGCNADKIAAVLSRYPQDDLEDMLEDGVIRVTCEFCRTEYRFGPDGAPIAT
ncbi:MAG: Hsp33 family molecular chaperone [Pseudomonadota bacterium]